MDEWEATASAGEIRAGRHSSRRRHDAAESVTNVVVGYLLALLTQALVFPLFGIHAAPAEHIGIAAIFTGVSLLRSYGIRRAFRWVEARHG